jgi:hypothetical protein
MIHIVGEFDGITRATMGDSGLLFWIKDSDVTEHLLKLKGKKVVLEIKNYYDKRSLNANRYFWRLCGDIAEALQTDKETIYQSILQEAGQWVDIECTKDTLEPLNAKFSYSEIVREDLLGNDPKIVLRGYFGSSSYNTKEMSQLIDCATRECKALDIPTWSQEEVDRLIAEWGQ